MEKEAVRLADYMLRWRVYGVINELVEELKKFANVVVDGSYVYISGGGFIGVIMLNDMPLAYRHISEICRHFKNIRELYDKYRRMPVGSDKENALRNAIIDMYREVDFLMASLRAFIHEFRWLDIRWDMCDILDKSNELNAKEGVLVLTVSANDVDVVEKIKAVVKWQGMPQLVRPM